MSKIIALVTAVLALNAASALASGPQNAITSIHDIPTAWTGVAGDIVQRADAAFNLTRVRHESRSEGTLLMITYDVDATLRIGARTMPVQQIMMMLYGANPSTAELYLRVNDELLKTVQILVRKDEATGIFTMNDPLANGTHRFAFSGSR